MVKNNFRIVGEPTPVVEFNTEDMDKFVCVAGAMVWKSRNIEMTTQISGGLKGAITRAVTHDTMFTNTYTSRGKGLVAFASSYIGEIVHLPIDGRNSYIVQKGGFLVSQGEIEIKPYIQKRMKASLFGGEGFVMQELVGSGNAFIELGGHIRELTLGEGQVIEVQTGNLAIMESTCQMDVVQIPGMVNKFMGGEGLYNTIVRGPGKVWLQSHPPKEVAANLLKALEETNLIDNKWI